MKGKSFFTSLKIEEASVAMKFVNSSPTHAFSWGLINLGWVYADLQCKHIQEVIGEGHAWWWRGRTGFLAIWEDQEDDDNEPGIQLVGCPVDNLWELLVDYRRLIGKMGYTSAGWVAPNQPDVITCLEKAGFTRSWDNSLYVYELRSNPI
jgi:hypothetical protein